MGNTVSTKKLYDIGFEDEKLDQPWTEVAVDHLKCCQEPPDVSLIIDHSVIPAHRATLSEKSKYFRTEFSNKANSDEITLKETNATALKCVLKYMYGVKLDYLYAKSIPLNEVFDVLVAARFYMVDTLEREILTTLKKQVATNLLLNSALSYPIEDLISYSADAIRKAAHLYEELQTSITFPLNKHENALVKNKIFDQLSLEAVKYVLGIYFDASEPILFSALVAWMRANPDHSDVFPDLLELIDLCLLKEEHLDAFFKPTNLVDYNVYQKILLAQQGKVKNVQKVVNKNVIKSVSDLCVVEGQKISSTNSTVASLASFRENIPIIIDLKQRYLLNCLKFFIKTNRKLRYTVSISTNMRNWKRVIYSKPDCSGQQTLFFKEDAVRFIRIQSDAQYFIIDGKVETYYWTLLVPTKKPLKPSRNLVRMKMWKTDSKPAGGFISGKLMNGGISHLIDGTSSIVYKFTKPYMIEKMKLRIGDDKTYYVEVSENKWDWTPVFFEENVSDWRTVTFKKRPVMYIRINGVGCSDDLEYFTLYKLECSVVSD
uniref:BTB domain-containing protein n=1 Tax=Panagrellus redivivus TaxID=6233 RepID=A0A7E4V388_PANRE